MIHGLNHYLGGTWDYNVHGARTLSAWVKSTGGPEFVVTVETADGNLTRLRPLRYQWNGTSTAAPYAWTGATPNVPLFGCGFTADGVWHRLERNLAADAAAAYPGETLLRVRGMTFNAYTQDLYLDDVRLSNAMTVEHNTMGPGVVGHILRVTQTDPTTYAQGHRWLHYDQVGSVLSESDTTGNFIQRHEQDTFGNTLSSWQTGLIGGDRTGWHHNTKEWDGDVGLVYMYQRWARPGEGVFMSVAPLPPFEEHPYSLFESDPLLEVDPWGENPAGVAAGGAVAVGAAELCAGGGLGAAAAAGAPVAAVLGVGMISYSVFPDSVGEFWGEVIGGLICPPAQYRAHDTNKQKKNKNKHDYGESRKRRDYNGEKGDKNRGYPRYPPSDKWRGPWPPKPKPPMDPKVDPGYGSGMKS